MTTPTNAGSTTDQATPNPFDFLERAAKLTADNGDETTQDQTRDESETDDDELTGDATEVPMPPETDPGEEDEDATSHDDEGDSAEEGNRFSWNDGLIDAIKSDPEKAIRLLNQQEKGIRKEFARADQARDVEELLRTPEGTDRYIEALVAERERFHGPYAPDNEGVEYEETETADPVARREIAELKAKQAEQDRARVEQEQRAQREAVEKQRRAYAAQNAPLLTKNLGFEVTADMADQAMRENPRAKTLTEAVKRTFPDLYADAKVTRQRAPQLDGGGSAPGVRQGWNPETGAGLLDAAAQAASRR